MDRDATPEKRIGDRERAATDARLRRAQDDGVLTLAEYDERSRDCFAARHQRELDLLVADLPETEPETDPGAAPAPRDEPTVHVEAPREEESRTPTGRRARSWWGRLALAAAVVVAGSAILGADQGASVFSSRTIAVGSGPVEVGVLFGSVTVVVPDGVTVTTSGLLPFGSVECRQACRTTSASLPPLEVSTRGVFGSVTVETASEAAAGGITRDDDRDDDGPDD